MNEFNPHSPLNYAQNNYEINRQMHEDPNRNDKIPQKPGRFLRILGLVLLAIFGVYFLCLIFVNPVTQFNLQTMIAQNGRITITIDTFGYYNETMILFDENCLYLPETKEYFVTEQGILYSYEKDIFGKWHKERVYSDNTVDIPDTLFYKDSYKRDGIFSCRLKKAIDSGDLTNVKFKKSFGQYIITGQLMVSNMPCRVTIKIHHIGFINIDIPWE